MDSILVILGIVGFMCLTIVLEQRNAKQRIRLKIENQFGKQPADKTESFENIELFWKENNIDDTKKLVDDGTWNDLDMADVFDRINSTCSFAGEQYLYCRLRTLSLNNESLKESEEIIDCLDGDEEGRKFIQEQLLKLGKKESSYYFPVFLNNIDVFGIAGSWFYRLMQILLILSVVLALLSRDLIFIGFAGTCFLINLIIYSTAKSRYETNIEVVGSIYSMLRVTENIVHNQKSQLKDLYVKLYESYASIKKSMKYFRFILNRKNTGYTGDFMEMAAAYLTGAFLIDFTTYNKILKFTKQNREAVEQLYEQIGKLDFLITVLSLRKSLPHYCLPEFGGKNQIVFEGLYHPLLKDPVLNSEKINGKLVVTGSNASGKSTFIKALVINQILAQSIHTCTAKSIRFPMSYVITSMAVKDNPLDGESYYIKEIKSLKRLIDRLSDQYPTVCAIDEILRGTNTKERLAASTAVLKYLAERNCILIVATHDLELLPLLEEQKFEYFYFSEQPGEQDVIFDYTLRRGVSRQTNAIKLLKVTEFPKEIYKYAGKIYKDLKI